MVFSPSSLLSFPSLFPVFRRLPFPVSLLPFWQVLLPFHAEPSGLMKELKNDHMKTNFGFISSIFPTVKNP